MKRFIPIVFALSMANAADPKLFVMSDTNGVLAVPTTFISSNAATIAAALPAGSIGTNQINSAFYTLVTAGGIPTIGDGTLTTNKIDGTFHGLLTTPNFTGTTLTINGSGAAAVQAAIRGAVNQSANIFEVQASNNATLFGVGPTGAVTAASFSGAMSYTNLTGRTEFDAVAYGADPTGTTDSTAEIQAAIDAAASTGFGIVKLSGRLVVSSPLIYKAPMRGDQMNRTLIISIETNGSPVISITDKQDVDIRDLEIQGHSSLNNMIGIQMGGVDASPWSSHFFFENVSVIKAETGWDVTGFIGTMVKCKARYCGTGFKGDLINASSLNLILEHNTTGFQISESASVQLTGVVENNATGGQLSDTDAVNINAYFEQNNTHLHVGYLAGSTNVSTGTSIDGYFYNSRTNGVVLDNSALSEIKNTAVFRNSVVRSVAERLDVVTDLVDDGLGNLQQLIRVSGVKTPALNYFPNPRFNAKDSGYRINKNQCTLSVETDTTLHGTALRLSFTNKANSPYFDFFMSAPLIAWAKGKTLTAAAWMYIPDSADFNYTFNNFDQPINRPDLSIHTAGGATNPLSTRGSAYYKTGYWNLFVRTLAIPTDVTNVTVRTWGTWNSGTGMTTSNHIIIGEMMLFGPGVNIREAVHNYEIAPIAGYYAGNNWVGYRPDLPYSTSESWYIGDVIKNSNKAAVGATGYVVDEWVKKTDGNTHVINTDWIENRSLTTLAPLYQPTNSNLTLLSAAGAGSALQVLRKASGNATMEWATISAGGLDEAAASLLYQGTNSVLTDLGDGSVSALTITTLSSDTHNVGTLAITNPLLYLPATNVLVKGSLTNSALTSTRVPFSNASQVLSDDADLTFATDTLYGTKITSTDVRAGAIISTNTLQIPSSDDTDVTIAGQLSWDTDGWMRAYDGANQVAIGRKIETIQATIIAPNDLADAVRDATLIWSNESGMSFVITGWKAWSGTDNTTLNIETTTGTGETNATVDTVEIATDGTGCFYASDTTITSGTIANGSLVWLDFDDTDTPTWVKVTIYGYYDANVN